MLRQKRGLEFTAVLVGGAVCASVACGGSAATVGGGMPPDASVDGTTTTQTGDDGGATAAEDGGGGGGGESDAPIDGQVVTEGGSNPITDGGDDAGGDTLPDGSACNAIPNDAVAISSVCASVAPILGGGALASGTYHLTAVTALATASFCHMGFVPTGFKGSLVLTVVGGVGSGDTVTLLANAKENRASVTLTPGAGNASPLTEEDTCPAASAPSQVRYQSTTSMTDGGAKTVLRLRLPYGKDSADYTYETE